MTQVGYLGSQAAKFMYSMLKYSFLLVFNPSNVTAPFKFLGKLLFGFDIGKVAK